MCAGAALAGTLPVLGVHFSLRPGRCRAQPRHRGGTPFRRDSARTGARTAKGPIGGGIPCPAVIRLERRKAKPAIRLSPLAALDRSAHHKSWRGGLRRSAAPPGHRRNGAVSGAEPPDQPRRSPPVRGESHRPQGADQGRAPAVLPRHPAAVSGTGAGGDHGCRVEGTGSLVLDRENKLAFACISPRTDAEVVAEFCKISGYQSVLFHATDQSGKAIYHTNVLMALGDRFAVICLDSIPDQAEKTVVKEALQSAGKEIVTISFEQMNAFAGNMLQLKNNLDESLLILSETAFLSLNEAQIKTLKKYCKLIYSPLNTIENSGGGSARCMLAEVFLPVKTASKIS
ncbi:MAG: hypothetical protein EOO38_02690 [Cytophagaceae bacterium]|nr:MAG: hypothetical protein EOO38_02690 [Cytophagaceae bacterium]